MSSLIYGGAFDRVYPNQHKRQLSNRCCSLFISIGWTSFCGNLIWQVFSSYQQRFRLQMIMKTKSEFIMHKRFWNFEFFKFCSLCGGYRWVNSKTFGLTTILDLLAKHHLPKQTRNKWLSIFSRTEPFSLPFLFLF